MKPDLRAEMGEEIVRNPTEHRTIRQAFGMNMNVGVGVSVSRVGAGFGVGPVQCHFPLVKRRTHQMAPCTFGGGISGGLGSNVPLDSYERREGAQARAASS